MQHTFHAWRWSHPELIGEASAPVAFTRAALSVRRVTAADRIRRECAMLRYCCLKHSLAVVALAIPQLLLAQATTLPAASRTVYKCVVAGKTVYTDEPCV